VISRISFPLSDCFKDIFLANRIAIPENVLASRLEICSDIGTSLQELDRVYVIML
jgi:hypothetical protein